jgi:DNA polymerase-3 subunit delta'
MPWDIIGHEWMLASLERSIASGHDSHAYLISGPPGVGKARLALRLAQALNCETARGSPCLQCRTCRRIEHGNHPDVRLASMETQAEGLSASDAARQKGLKIDTIREWQRDIALKPYEGRRRVFILHDADRLSEEASNAMLKTLEEPPSFATLILVANGSTLLATIVSRCQPVRLGPLPHHQVAQALTEQAGMDAEQAAILAAWSGGRIGWAFSMARSPERIQSRQEQLDELLAIQEQPRYAAFRWAEERSKEYRGGEQEAVLARLELWQSWWRDVLMLAAGCPDTIIHQDRRRELEQVARHATLPDVSHFLTRINETISWLRENVNPQLALENLFLHLPVSKTWER